jgi:hypothetical protein
MAPPATVAAAVMLLKVMSRQTGVVPVTGSAGKGGGLERGSRG